MLVDVNDRSSQGQVLVELDTAKLSDQVARRARLAAAQAQLAEATATLRESQASLPSGRGRAPVGRQGAVCRRARRRPRRLGRAQASEDSARAAITQAQAPRSTDETNLAKASSARRSTAWCSTRTVEPGNAVAASLQAVTLLTIAEDLRRMRVEVSVDEADVGAVRVGQAARFSVSPTRRPVSAEVTRVAFGPTKTDNVITYTTVLGSPTTT